MQTSERAVAGTGLFKTFSLVKFVEMSGQEEAEEGQEDHEDQGREEAEAFDDVSIGR